MITWYRKYDLFSWKLSEWKSERTGGGGISPSGVPLLPPIMYSSPSEVRKCPALRGVPGQASSGGSGHQGQWEWEGGRRQAAGRKPNANLIHLSANSRLPLPRCMT